MQDKKIIELYLNRNEKAIKETDKKYGKFCYSIAYNILFNSRDTQEAVNDTYFGVWNSIPPHKPDIFSAFIGKITRRISIDMLRKRNAQKRSSGETEIVLNELSECLTVNSNNTENAVDHIILTDIINDFLESLPIEERHVFMCRYWYMDRIKSISRQFGFSEAKIKSMLFRTRKKLKSVLEEEGFYLDT